MNPSRTNMARQVKAVTNTTDKLGNKIVVDLYGGAYSENEDDYNEENPGLRYATSVVRVLGAQYSYAYIGIPVNEFGYEWAPAVALQKTGPAGKTKLRSRAKVSMVDSNGKKIPLLVGYLVQYAHTIDEDSVVGMVMDDRWLLSKVTCYGRAIYDPDEKKKWFDAGERLVFNRDGYPDCIDGPLGPMFAPGRLWGYKPQNSIEYDQEPDRGTERARSWTCQDVAAYLRYMYYLARRPSHPADYGRQQLSQYIDWPASFGNQKDFTRVPRNFDCENLEVGEALARCCRKAGPFELQCKPNNWRGTLGIVQVNHRRASTYLTGPTWGSSTDGGDINAALSDNTRVSGGTIIESIVGYFDDTCIAGDPPALEHQFSMADSTDGNVPVELEPAWGTTDETHWNQINTDNGGDEASFQLACQAEPKVFAAYRVSAGYQAYLRTKWPEACPPSSPRFLARLLSGYSMGSTSPRDWNPREITIEYLDDTKDPPVWTPCSRYDNLELVDDGMAFMVTALRDGGTRVTLKKDGDVYVGNKLRLTCAVEREFRITGHNNDDPNNTSSRINNLAERFTFLAVAEPGDYTHWERYKSKPNGNADLTLGGLFPDKATGSSADGKYLFSDLEDVTQDGMTRIARHAKRRNEDVKRIDYNGVLTMHTWNPSLKPGDMVSLDVGGNSIQPQAVIRSVKFDSITQSQEIELMSGDNSVIYDMPLPSSPQGSGGGAPTNTGSKPSTAPTIGPCTAEDAAAQSEIEYQKAVAAKRASTPSEGEQSGGGEQSTSSTGSSTGTPSGSRSKGLDEDTREILSEIESNTPPPPPPPRRATGPGKIYRPGEFGWNRMLYEENQSPHGIRTGEATKQSDYDVIKRQRREEGLTVEERRAARASAAPDDERAAARDALRLSIARREPPGGDEE